MSVRPYQEKDLDEVLDVYMLAKNDELANEPHHIKTAPFTENPLALELFENSQVYVYVMDEKVVGFVGHQGNHIIWMYVHPDYRSRKVAYALIQYVLENLQGEVHLSLLKSNLKAFNFYKKVGFKLDSEFTGEHQGITIHAVKMTMQLSDTYPAVQAAS